MVRLHPGQYSPPETTLGDCAERVTAGPHLGGVGLITGPLAEPLLSVATLNQISSFCSYLFIYCFMFMSLILAHNVPVMGGEAQPVGAAGIEAFALGTQLYQ